ncbi:hypothetical protein [Deinococcus sp. UYEF24]
MSVYVLRDVWDDMPGVVVLAEAGAEDGELKDAVLCLGEKTTSPVRVSDPDRLTFLLHIPEEHLNEACIVPGIDLRVELTK